MEDFAIKVIQGEVDFAKEHAEKCWSMYQYWKEQQVLAQEKLFELQDKLLNAEPESSAAKVKLA